MNLICRFFVIIVSILILLINTKCSEETPTNSQPEKGSISIDSNPQGAEIFLQGTSTGKVTPDVIENLVPDNYDLKIKLSEFVDTLLVANVKSGLKTTIFIDFSIYFGKLFIDSDPQGAQIFINGVDIQKVTPDTLSLAPGNYQVKLIFNSGDEIIRDVIIESGVTKYLQINDFGKIFVSSNPSGAQIWLDGINTGLTTPDTVNGVQAGVRNITLKLPDYYDTTFVISVIAEQTSIAGPITLVSNIVTILYGPVRIYETTGTTVNQPAGLDLSSGIAYGMSSAQNGLIDIYYSSNGYLIQSADLYPNLVRVTKFYIGSSDNLFDEIDSPNRNTG